MIHCGSDTAEYVKETAGWMRSLGCNIGLSTIIANHCICQNMKFTIHVKSIKLFASPMNS